MGEHDPTEQNAEEPEGDALDELTAEQLDQLIHFFEGDD